jgi:hypothetical protein
MKSKSKHVIFLAGIGSGKSFLLGIWTYKHLQMRKGALGLLTAPVFDTLNNSTMPKVQEAWSLLGLEEDRHYVIGRKPPKEWNVRPYSRLYSGKISTWINGSYIILDGSDNFNKHRGTELDFIAIDEFRDIKPMAFGMYMGRLRGIATKNDLTNESYYQILACTTPPEDIEKITQYEGVPNFEIITASTYENEINLPKDYINSLKEMYDEITFRREVLGELISLAGTRVCYTFSEQNIVQHEFDREAPTTMTWDFNSESETPLVTILTQKFWRSNKEIKITTKEFGVKNNRTEYQCQMIRQYLIDNKFTGTLICTGDHSGNRKESCATRSDYAIIKEYFDDFNEFHIITRPTLSVKDRISSLNAQYCNFVGERKKFVDYRCKLLIDDLYKCVWSIDGLTMDKSNKNRTHFIDADSYEAYNFDAIDRKLAKVSSN